MGVIANQKEQYEAVTPAGEGGGVCTRRLHSRLDVALMWIVGLSVTAALFVVLNKTIESL